MKLLGLMAVVALVSVSSSAGEPQPGPGFSSVGNFGAAWSPDGRSIAFASYGARHPQIHVIDLAARRVRRVTHDSLNDYEPIWLRDGRIAFHGQDAGGDFVAFLSSDGRTVKIPWLSTDLVAYARGGKRIYHVDWSPDGKRVAYTVHVQGMTHDQVWVANADGSGARLLVSDAGQPDWSPDGERIAYVGWTNTGRPTIHMIAADGTGDVQVTQGGQEFEPDWAPDASRIAYVEGPFPYNLAVVNADGTGEHELTPRGPWTGAPAWSPDGQLIAFTSRRTVPEELWLIRPDGTQLRRLTFGGCTIIGTTRADVLIGGTRRDVICGFDGDDILRGLGGEDKLVGGLGSDRLFGGPGDDRLAGEEGDDRLEAGAGRDRLDGGAGVDTSFADAEDTVYAVEHTHGGRPGHVIVLPSASEITSKTRAAVKASRARVYELLVRVPELYQLTVRVQDPAAYLRYRVNTALAGIRKAIRLVRFHEFDFAVRGPSGVVFWYKQTLHGPDEPAGVSSSWYVRPDLINCVTGIDLDIEVNPDGGGPPCLA